MDHPYDLDILEQSWFILVTAPACVEACMEACCCSRVIINCSDYNFVHFHIYFNLPVFTLTKPKFYNSSGHVTHYPLRVNLRLTIEAIESISEVDMEMSVTFLMQQFWNDSRLQRRNGETTIMPMALIPKIWKPDVSIQGAKRALIHATTVDNHVMRIGEYGDISYRLFD